MVAMNAAHPFGFSQGEADAHERKPDATCGLPRSAPTGQAQRRLPGRAKGFPIPSILKAKGRDRSEGALLLSPLYNGRKRMPETLLDFDTADAFRGRGSVAR